MNDVITMPAQQSRRACTPHGRTIHVGQNPTATRLPLSLLPPAADMIGERLAWRGRVGEALGWSGVRLDLSFEVPTIVVLVELAQRCGVELVKDIA